MYIQRNAHSILSDLLAGFPVVTITGPRQSGKTTLAKHFMPDKPYISLEDPDSFDYAKNDPSLYEHALRMSNKKAEECVYIGDNPYLDFEAPNKLNILTFRLMRGEFKNIELKESDAKIRINNFFELEDRLL